MFSPCVSRAIWPASNLGKLLCQRLHQPLNYQGPRFHQLSFGKMALIPLAVRSNNAPTPTPPGPISICLNTIKFPNKRLRRRGAQQELQYHPFEYAVGVPHDRFAANQTVGLIYTMIYVVWTIEDVCSRSMYEVLLYIATLHILKGSIISRVANRSSFMEK